MKREVSNDDLMTIFRSVQLQGQSRKGTSLIAANFVASDFDAQVDFFNETILPVYDEMDRPEMNTANWLTFQDAVFAIFRGQK